MTQPLAGKFALVTGGSRGIGAAIVRRLAADGAAVAFTYASAAAKAQALVEDVEAAGGRAIAIRADSGDPDGPRAAVAQTAAAYGRIDILVSNAGVMLQGPVEGITIEAFDEIFAINVRGVFVGVQAVLPHMGEGGRIITTGSVVAERSGFPGSVGYSMSKGAVAAMTRALARDLGPRGITVNAIAPGPTLTDMNDVPGLEERVRPFIALGRMGKDHEIAALAAWLAGPESSFVTGANLSVDGGYLA